MTERERLNKITESIIGAAIQVHRVLGPGLLESAYVACLAYELGKRGLLVKQQKAVPLVYEEVKLDCPDDSQMTPVTEGALPDSGVVPNRLATGRELPLRELWRGCPRRLQTTKGTGDLNLFTFSDKIKQDAENGRS
jgi:hypothetical protein